ncbi:NAD-dependent protein deacetylase sirtuin-2 [Podila epigama]|nr:NAD-dependent protein deacetylase sirtuin-2 [Podila epigama]
MSSSKSNRPLRNGKAEPVPRASVLQDNTLEAVAKFINDGKAKNIIVMTGAGISTAAGIKDFRSPGTGLYDDLEKYNLPYPEAVFDISFFRDTPGPFYRLAKELFPGNYRPTLTHYLLPLLAKKKLLLRSYTQNIDMLERLTGIDEDLLVEAHGGFSSSRCIDCSRPFESARVKKHILEGLVPICEGCGGLVKPDITFFGEDLPERFGQLTKVDFKKCDLLIVLGTSLQVEPFNRLITLVPTNCPRLLINRERAGENMRNGFDFDDKWRHPVKRDALFLGNCDDGVKKLAQLCGWEKELRAMYDKGHAQMKLAEEMEALVLAAENEADDTSSDKVEETTKVTITTSTTTATTTTASHKEVTTEDTSKVEKVDKFEDELEQVIGKFETSTIISATSTTSSTTAEDDESEVSKTLVETETVIVAGKA